MTLNLPLLEKVPQLESFFYGRKAPGIIPGQARLYQIVVILSGLESLSLYSQSDSSQ